MLFSADGFAGNYSVQRGSTSINYMRMSKEMGLHVPSMSAFHSSNSRVMNVGKLKDALMAGMKANEKFASQVAPASSSYTGGPRSIVSGYTDNLSEVREVVPSSART
jgi:hypothetical protein